MIVSFRDTDTESLARGRRVRRFQPIESVARRKLRQLEIAGRLDDLSVPPGNRLERLRGDRAVNTASVSTTSFASAFAGPQPAPTDVEIVDYH